MSDRLGFLERKIIALLRYGRRPWPLKADHIAERIYPELPDLPPDLMAEWDAYERNPNQAPSDALEQAVVARYRKRGAQHVAVLRAMGSVARKYPDKFVLRGGKGRAPLVIMPAKDAPQWDEYHAPRRRHRKAGSSIDELALRTVAELEEHVHQAHERIAAHVKHIEGAHARIAERDAYIAELEAELARERKKRRRKPRQ
jgi:hypothetical protein